MRTADQRGGAKGYNAGKKVTGRKRHILTDTDGRLLCICVHAANIRNRDGGYAGRLVGWAADKTYITLDIIRRGARTKGFEVLARCWVMERTFA